MMASFDYNYENPSLFQFAVLIMASDLDELHF